MKRFLLLFSLFAAGCTSHVLTEEKKETAPDINYDNRLAADAVLRCINEGSSRSCSLTAEGSITLREGSSSQSGHFELKSKRLAGNGDPRRVDSLSMIVT